MAKSIIFLADGMADEPLAELGGKTPLEAVDTPYMDLIASQGASGTFLTLPDGFPTSSDVANMSVLGYELDQFYPGRGPLEAVSQGIEMEADDIAFRCNLVYAQDGILRDYSAGHLDNQDAKVIFEDLQQQFGNEEISFHHGVSYRNLIVLHGKKFSSQINYFKPDSSQDEPVEQLQLSPADESAEAAYTVEFLQDMTRKTAAFLEQHPLNKGKDSPANLIWPWSPGRKPAFSSFAGKYQGRSAAVISAVDVILGIAKCASMEIIPVEGATGFIDTNYEGKATAAIEALKTHDFVYLHVEATDECSHMGDLNLKMKAIDYFENRIVKPVMEALKDSDVTFAILPDHPVPIHLRKHTRTPVPFAICGPGIKGDSISVYSETEAPKGSLGLLKGDELMQLVLGLK